MNRSSFFIAFFATIIRYYDYALFGLSAAILAKNFLPIAEEQQQILGFFAILGGAVIMRPIGSLVFGFIGDKYGRVISVKISIILATTSTILIGCTPNFQQIGNYATLALILCRMTFLMSLAGEVDAIKVYVAEKSRKQHKNFANGIVSACSQVGALLAAAAYHYANRMEAVTYMWRLNFIIGGIFGILIILMRNYFKESDEFIRYKAEVRCTKSSRNIWLLIKNMSSFFIIAAAVSGTIGGIYHFLVIFLGVFLSHVASIIDPSYAQTMNMVLIVTYSVGALCSGFLADIIGPRNQIKISLIFSILAAIVMQTLLAKQVFIIYLPMFLILCASFYTVPLQIMLQSMFMTGDRMKMYSLSHSIGSIIFSSTTPFFCILLWKYFGSLSLIMGYFTCLLIILSSGVMFLCKNPGCAKSSN